MIGKSKTKGDIRTKKSEKRKSQGGIKEDRGK